MGPLQNKTQFEKVKEFLVDGAARGKVIAGGKALDRDGYFIAPTIVRDIPDDARLVREEQFGPVLPVLRYSSLDDAIARANGTEYGLGGTVWGADSKRAFEVAQRMAVRHRMGQQAPGTAARYPVWRREAIRLRYRDGPGRTGGIHSVPGSSIWRSERRNESTGLAGSWGFPGFLRGLPTFGGGGGTAIHLFRDGLDYAFIPHCLRGE